MVHLFIELCPLLLLPYPMVVVLIMAGSTIDCRTYISQFCLLLCGFSECHVAGHFFLFSWTHTGIRGHQIHMCYTLIMRLLRDKVVSTIKRTAAINKT